MRARVTAVKDQARMAAVAAMTAVTEEGALLSAALVSLVEKLTPADRARAGRLATESLRWASRSDRALSPYLRMKPEDPVMNALRLALYEIYVAGVPPHGAVSAAVDLVGKPKAGLVNAVLRNIQRSELVWDDLPTPVLPKWLRKPLVRNWGKEAVAAMEAVFAGSVPLDLSFAGDAAKWEAPLGGVALPTGSLRLEASGQVSALPGFEEGAWWVQDAAAAFGAKLLQASPGEDVLDLCAAPGGKTMQLAATGAKVTALDDSETRMERLYENLMRTGLKAETIVADALSWEPEGSFDAILLDAPCSATGTLRRHPDLAFAKDIAVLDDLVPLQAQMLDRAVGWLKPGGRLVFCTCSLLPEEGEAQLAGVLERHKNLKADTPELPWIEDRWKALGGGLRIRPDHWADKGGIDGFFIAVLRKRT